MNKCSECTTSKLHLQHWRRQRKSETRALLREMKESTPCTDCGEFYPHYMMDFDHVPERGEKKFAVMTVGTYKITDKNLVDEIAKCDIVCKNCHGARTWFRNQDEEE